MPSYTRGEFLKLSAILAGAAALVRQQRAPAAPTNAKGPGVEPDLVVVNARVYTLDPARPRAEAFAVKDGRFLAVGSTSDVRNLAAPGRTRVIDAGRMTVT